MTETDDELFERTKLFVWNCLRAQNPSTQLVEQVARKVIEALPSRAVLRTLEARGWQPIESAPDDGTEIDVWRQCYQDGKATTGYREANAAFTSGKWYDIEGYALEWKDALGQECRVTHWMPTPPAPEGGDE